jgi:hypothetical protein
MNVPFLSMSTTSPDASEPTLPPSEDSPPQKRHSWQKPETTGNFWTDLKLAFQVNWTPGLPPHWTDRGLWRRKRLSLRDDLRRLEEVPCARNSLMSGIASGVGLGAVRAFSTCKRQRTPLLLVSDLRSVVERISLVDGHVHLHLYRDVVCVSLSLSLFLSLRDARWTVHTGRCASGICAENVRCCSRSSSSRRRDGSSELKVLLKQSIPSS